MLQSYIMHRTQVLLEPELYRRAVRLARARKSSLGELVREALQAKLAAEEAGDAVFDRLTRDPYDDPAPDPLLALDVDHYLYGAPRRGRARR
jgi:hypothetical protein